MISLKSVLVLYKEREREIKVVREEWKVDGKVQGIHWIKAGGELNTQTWYLLAIVKLLIKMG